MHFSAGRVHFRTRASDANVWITRNSFAPTHKPANFPVRELRDEQQPNRRSSQALLSRLPQSRSALKRGNKGCLFIPGHCRDHNWNASCLRTPAMSSFRLRHNHNDTRDDQKEIAFSFPVLIKRKSSRTANETLCNPPRPQRF